MKKFSSAESLYESLKNIKVDNPLCQYSLDRCNCLLPKINEILELKEKTQSSILAHSYVHPDIIYGVADFVGDSYELSKNAQNIDSDTIVFAAVKFMAETAKIINPNKIILDPNLDGRCSLADSITLSEVKRLRDKYKNHTFVCYINTTAAIKAYCDVCVTSSNAQKIIENIPNDKIYFLPDRFMGKNIQNKLKEKKIDKELLYYSGRCHVHEEYEKEQVEMIKKSYPKAMVIAHPECKEEVISQANMVGSTSQMFNYVEKHKKNNKFLLLTECGITARLQVEHPDCDIVGTCTLCKYMRNNSLDNIIQTLKDPKSEQIIELEEEIIINAQKSLHKMFELAEK